MKSDMLKFITSASHGNPLDIPVVTQQLHQELSNFFFLTNPLFRHIHKTHTNTQT